MPQFTGAWPMEPGHLESLRVRLAGDRLPEDHVKSAMTRSRMFSDQVPLYSVEDGVAHINVKGTLLKSVPMWAFWFGIEATATADIAKAVRQASEDQQVKKILLRVDSPGGSVAGIEDAADAIFEARKKKEVVALVEDMAASAAYWLASQASTIVAAPGSQVGSIGVYMVSVDSSRLAENNGVTVRVHRSGDLKGAGVRGAPLTDAQLAYYDEHVEELGEVFRSTVARGRGMDAGKVKKLATGRMWRGAEAQSFGLVDRMESIPSALKRIAGAVKEARMADEQELKNATASGVEQERERVRSIYAHFPEDQEFAREHVEAGSTLDEASRAFVPYIREKAAREKDEAAAEAAAQARAEAKGQEPPKAPKQKTQPVPYGGSGDPDPVSKGNFVEQARALAKEEGITMREAMSRISRENPDVHASFVMEAHQHKIKVDPKTGAPRVPTKTTR